MKKKILIWLLCAALLLPVFGMSAAAAEKPVFVAINDTLPPELVGCVATHNGTTYVPYYIFTNYSLGLYGTYSNETSTLTLHASDRQLSFDIMNGKTYDGDNYKYSVSGIVRSGNVYVPLNFTSRFFGGISYSQIAGNEYGSILRITNGSEVLTDAEFLRAAKSAMRTYAMSYQGPTTNPQTPETPPENIHEGEPVDLSFIGLPAAGILERLTQNNATACFFLTAEDVRSAPDTVRRLVCGGHSLGVYCMEDLAAEYEETAALMFAAARAVPELVTAGAEYAEACRELARMAGLVYCEFDLNSADSNVYAITSQLEVGSGGASLLLGGGEDCVGQLSVLLAYLVGGKFNAAAPRETGRRAA